METSDRYAPEHVQVMAADTDWWKANLKNYGSLFLGEASTVTHGDKCSGTNHILPTGRAARYAGGLNVLRFLKILTHQELSEEANKVFSAAASRMSRVEGMEGHARACDWRLRKYFPDEDWDFEVYGPCLPKRRSGTTLDRMKKFEKSFTQQEPISEEAIARAVEVMRTGRLHRYDAVADERTEAEALEFEFVGDVVAKK